MSMNADPAPSDLDAGTIPVASDATFGDHPLRDTTQDGDYPAAPTPANGPAPTPVRDLATTKERKLPGRLCTVELDGLEPFEVRIDNRDYLRWDKTAPRRKWGSGRDVPFLMATFLAWSAATRAGLTTMPWETFEECAVAVDTIEEDADARPTR
jgi:hypothetical protein